MTTVFPYLFLFILAAEAAMKLRFDNLPSRRVKNPNNLNSVRRTFGTPRDALCRTVGATAGALIAHRLSESGSLSNGERLAGHSLLDLRSLVTLIALSLATRLETASNCPRSILKFSAIEMCNMIICNTNGAKLPREKGIAIALTTYGVLGAIPSLSAYRQKLSPPTRDCQRLLYNLRLTNSIDFHRNPQKYVYSLIYGLDHDVLQVQQILKANHAQPFNIPPIQVYGHQDYMQAAVQGAVIASHLIKSIQYSGRITTVREPRIHDSVKLVAFTVCRLINAIKIRSSHLAYRTHNIALKLTLYWLINNRNIAELLHTGDLTIESLKTLGLAAYFPQTPRIVTNDAIVRPQGTFLKFSDMAESLDATAAILIQRILIKRLPIEINTLLPNEPVTIPDEVIAMEVVPVPGTADYIQHASDMIENTGGLGALPDPNGWFATTAPAKNATNDANIVYMGTLAVVIGTHASRIIPQMGLVTHHGEPGYRHMTHIDVYTILQKILQKFIAKLMTVVPMSLDQGFYMLNAAFKSSKLSLHMKDTPSSMMIPLALKHYDLLQFHPQLQHIKWELWPVPPTLQVLYLWAQPELGVNLTNAIDQRLTALTHQIFPNILADILQIMKHHMPELSIYNLKDLHAKSNKYFKWDPADAMSFLYDPETTDGVPAKNHQLIDAPHTPLECPGHIFCPQQPCKKSDCGLYACDSRNSWCYYPKEIHCPGSITCPVYTNFDEKPRTCPQDPECPIVAIQCPGRSECPDQVSNCPGSASCPLSVKCPGPLCPNRYTTRPQILLPCPLHPSCSQPIANQVACTNDQSCDYEARHESQVAAAIKEAGNNIASVIDKKESILQISNSAVSQVSVNGNHETHSTSASATSHISSESGKIDAAAAAEADTSQQ